MGWGRIIKEISTFFFITLYHYQCTVSLFIIALYYPLSLHCNVFSTVSYYFLLQSIIFFFFLLLYRIIVFHCAVLSFFCTLYYHFSVHYIIIFLYTVLIFSIALYYHFSLHCIITFSSLYKSTGRAFVCVEVLRPSQPNEVMSSAVSLPNHTFTGQA